MKETKDGHTHYVSPFALPDTKSGLYRAVCGARIRKNRHAVLASCPKCDAHFLALSAPTTKEIEHGNHRDSR